MEKFKHTEHTAAVYNKIIKEYREISCDSDLEKIGIDYYEYRSSELGFLLDSLRFNGEGVTGFKNVAEWMKRNGCNVHLIDKTWRVQL